jgi:hypothetical protein
VPAPSSGTEPVPLTTATLPSTRPALSRIRLSCNPFSPDEAGKCPSSQQNHGRSVPCPFWTTKRLSFVGTKISRVKPDFRAVSTTHPHGDSHFGEQIPILHRAMKILYAEDFVLAEKHLKVGAIVMLAFQPDEPSGIPDIVEWSSVYRQFRRWTLSGLWELLLEAFNERISLKI